LSDAVLKAPDPLFKIVFRHTGQIFAGRKISIWSFSRSRETREEWKRGHNLLPVFLLPCVFTDQ